MQVRYYTGTSQDARHNMERALREHNTQLARQESGWAWTDMKRGDAYLHGCNDRAAIAVFDRELIKLCTDLRRWFYGRATSRSVDQEGPGQLEAAAALTRV